VEEKRKAIELIKQALDEDEITTFDMTEGSTTKHQLIIHHNANSQEMPEMPKKTKSKATKKVLFRQNSYLRNTVTNVFREIEVDIPITMDSENLSEKKKRSLIEVAIKSGLISDEWHLDTDLVDDNQSFDADLVDEDEIITECLDELIARMEEEVHFLLTGIQLNPNSLFYLTKRKLIRSMLERLPDPDSLYLLKRNYS
jgi:hypothetical protein